MEHCTSSVTKRPYPKDRAARKLIKPCQLLILHTILRKPGILLREIQKEIEDILLVEVSLSTISKFIYQNGFTRQNYGMWHCSKMLFRGSNTNRMYQYTHLRCLCLLMRRVRTDATRCEIWLQSLWKTRTESFVFNSRGKYICYCMHLTTWTTGCQHCQGYFQW